MEEAKKTAFDIRSKDNPELKVEPADLAELMFFIGEYSESAVLYDSDLYAPDSRWLGQYFYCLKAMGEKDKAKRKLDESVEFINSFIEHLIEEQEQNPQNWTQDDKDSYLSGYNKNINDILDCYERVMVKNEKPSVTFNPWIIKRCYYINCPRHSRQVFSS